MTSKRKIITLSILTLVVISLLLAATLIPIDTKSVRWCGEYKIRFSLVIGQKNEFEKIVEWPKDRIFTGACLINSVDEVNLYIL